MILQLKEIKPGLVAYLDPSILLSFGANGPRLIRGVHPFVCLEVEGDWCIWTALSSSSLLGSRTSIDAAFKRGPTDSWLNRDTYIYGPCFWYEGPLHAFQEASAESEYTRPGDRNSLTAEGLQFVQDRVQTLSRQIGGAA